MVRSLVRVKSSPKHQRSVLAFLFFFFAPSMTPPRRSPFSLPPGKESSYHRFSFIKSNQLLNVQAKLREIRDLRVFFFFFVGAGLTHFACFASLLMFLSRLSPKRRRRPPKAAPRRESHIPDDSSMLQ